MESFGERLGSDFLTLINQNQDNQQPNYQKQVHLGWLDAIRGAAALYVVCHHAVMQVVVIGDHANDIFYRILQLLTIYGHYAVDVFIVLSGYCLMLPVVAKQKFGSVGVFYLRRTIRIVLPYYAALIVSLLLIYLLLGEQDGSHWALTSLPVSIVDLLKHILLIHQWFPNSANKINPAFWSVGVEYQIYFLFPFFYWLTKKIGFAFSFMLITSVSYSLWGLSYNLNIMNPSSTGTSVYYCALFFMGMTAAQLTMNTEITVKKNWLAFVEANEKMVTITALIGILITAVAGFLIERFLPTVFFPLQIQSLFIGLYFSILLYLKGINKPNVKYHLNKSYIQAKLQWLGTMGFSIYLLHDPILAIVWKYVVTPMHLSFYWLQTLAELFFGILATIAVAMVFYKCIELPCHHFSKSIANR